MALACNANPTPVAADALSPTASFGTRKATTPFPGSLLPTWFESDSGLLRNRQHCSSTFHGHFIDMSWAIVDEMPMKCP